MKTNFYNPFRPHIVEFDSGIFAVRRLRIFGWEYYDNQKIRKDDYWWTPFADQKAKQYYLVDTLEMAQTLLEMLKLRKTIKSTKVRKIHP